MMKIFLPIVISAAVLALILGTNLLSNALYFSHTARKIAIRFYIVLIITLVAAYIFIMLGGNLCEN